jgi:hypothetical protein
MVTIYEAAAPVPKKPESVATVPVEHIPRIIYYMKDYWKMTKRLQEELPYISPNQLASRWQCSRASVDRIARRAGIPRLCLGEGKNGTVRYPF